jgi:outer membrane receptor protein involved in Fe transport
MNCLRVSCLRDSAAALPALVVLLAVALSAASIRAQTADTSPPAAPAAPTDQTGASAQAPVPVTQTSGTDQTPAPVKLNPFEVSADQARGYFTPNTTSGTRLNNNIGDIPSSVTVIDKQQIQDTNSPNINDIMSFEAGAEGSHTYTPQTGFTEGTQRVDDALSGSNDVAGSIGGSSTASTRINGLGAPDNEVDDFFGIYRIPFDTYNVQSIEIDRGPNSLMFGSGSPAGIVNASSADAQINRFTGDISLQASSFGGFRQTADLNVPLIRDHAALYMAEEYTSVGEQREPSSNLTRRQYLSLNIDPFKTHKTKITASAEFWNNFANDENTLLPTDFVTPWLAAGRPVFNPINQMVTYLGTGKTIGPYVSSTTSPNYVAGNPTGTGALTSITSPLFVPGIGGAQSHFTEFYANGQFLYGFNTSQTLGSNFGGLIPAQVPTTPLTASQALVRSEFITTSAQLPIPGVGTPGAPGGYSSYLQPSAVNPNIYNAQTGPNIDGTDYTRAKARTYHFDLQQNILPNLDLDIGYFRQEYHDLEMDPDNQHSNGNPSENSLFVDTNAVLLNGAPNAYAGSTFIEDYQGDGFQHPEINANWRAMLSYSLDLRDKVPSWLKWLGHHRFLVEASTHDDIQQTIRLRTVIDGGDGSYGAELYQLNNMPAIPGNYNIDGEGQNEQRWQYLSTPGNYAATQKTSVEGIPGYGSPQTVTTTLYNYTTGTWSNSTLHQASPAFNGYQITENVQDQKTYYWQSFFFNDRITASLGINDDIVKNRSGATIYNAVINGVPTATTNNAGLVAYVNGVENPALKYYLGPWNPTSTTGIYQPNTTQLAQSSLGEIGGNTYSEGFVARPFENWSGIDAAANNGNLIAAVARTLGFTFNKADNFNPPSGTYTDLLGNPIGKPAGTEKDYGLEIATPDKKLYLRMTWFKSSNANNTSASYTITGRELYVDQNEMKNWARTIVELNSGEDPTSTQFDNTTNFPISAAQYAQEAALTGLNVNYLQSGGAPLTGGYFNPIATNTTTSGGYDLEITYNPLPNWTMKITGGRQDGSVSSVDSQAKAYQAVRMPVWLTAAAPQYPNVFTNWKGAGTTAIAYVGNFWNSYGYDGNTGSTGGPNGTANTVGNYFNNVVTVPIAVEEAAQGSEVPEETEYSFQYLTNYNFVTGPLKNLGIGGDLHWLGSTLESYYGSQTLLNASGQVAAYALNEPIYYPAQLHADAWISYSFKLPWDDGKIRAKVQLNCTDLTSNGYIEPIQYNLDGVANTYRIIPPRQWALTTTFSF